MVCKPPKTDTIVSVKMIDLGFFFEDRRDFSIFAMAFYKSNENKMFQSDFMKILRKEFVGPTKWRCFIEWYIFQVSFGVLLVHYYAAVLHNNFAEESDTYQFVSRYVLGGIILIIIAILINQELIGVCRFGFRYQPLGRAIMILTPVTIGYFSHYGPAIWIIIQNFFEIDYDELANQRQLAQFSIFMCWAVIFLWCSNMFESFAFYQLLTLRTIIDIGPIFLQFVILLAFFGAIMYMAQ